MSDEFGPFRIGEVVLMTIDCPCMDKKAGDEVTIASEFLLHGNCLDLITGTYSARAGWLVEERNVSPRYYGCRMLVLHGQVRRKPKPQMHINCRCVIEEDA